MLNEKYLNLFLYTIKERQKIYELRARNAKFPWTDDKIFQKYRFCNVFRQNDRQTKWIVDNYLDKYPNHKNLFVVPFIFRIINLGKTLDDFDLLSNFTLKELYLHLDLKVKNGAIYSPAYTILGDTKLMKGRSRHYFTAYYSAANMLENKDKIHDILIKNPCSFQNVFEEISKLKLVGYSNFTLYQVLLDLTYTRYLEKYEDGMDFVIIGPGATKGIKILTDDKNYLQIIKNLTEIINKSKIINKKIDLHFTEFWLCEFSKYCSYLNGSAKRRRLFTSANGKVDF